MSTVLVAQPPVEEPMGDTTGGPVGVRQPGSRAQAAARAGWMAHPYAVLALALVAAVWLITALRPEEPDVVLYGRYATGLLHGPLGSSLPHEYPALAEVVLLAPKLVPLAYPMAFSLLMAAALGAFLWSGRIFGLDWLVGFTCYTILAAATVVLARYDVLPALAAFLGVRAARRSNWGPAWLWIIAGGLLKVFPLVLLPGFVLVERRRSGRWPIRRLVAACAGLGLFALVQQLVAPGTVLNPLHYEAGRGFEYGSFPGTLTLLVSPFHLSWQYAFGNVQILGAGHSTIAAGTVACGVGLLGLVWWLAYRGRLNVEAASLATLSIVVLANKSLAPQYLLWLAPLWALWPMRRSWVAAAVLTAFVYPFVFFLAPGLDLSHPLVEATVLGAARNLVLAGGTAAWLWTEVRSGGHPNPALPAGGQTLTTGATSNVRTPA